MCWRMKPPLRAMREKYRFRLRDIREARDMTQKELAFECYADYDYRITQQNVSYFENARRTPRLEVVMFFAEFFGVSLDEMFERVDNGR
jgi:transcriptional regulator with XRE-family HTH domain